MQLVAHGVAFGDHLGEEVCGPMDSAQRGLRAEGDGVGEVFDFEDRLLGVPDDRPEDDGVDAYGDGVPVSEDSANMVLTRDARDRHICSAYRALGR